MAVFDQELVREVLEIFEQPFESDLIAAAYDGIGELKMKTVTRSDSLVCFAEDSAFFWRNTSSHDGWRSFSVLHSPVRPS